MRKWYGWSINRNYDQKRAVDELARLLTFDTFVDGFEHSDGKFYPVSIAIDYREIDPGLLLADMSCGVDMPTEAGDEKEASRMVYQQFHSIREGLNNAVNLLIHGFVDGMCYSHPDELPDNEHTAKYRARVQAVDAQIDVLRKFIATKASS